MILAAISIQALTNTGLFAKANDAKTKTEIAREIEQIKLSITTVITYNYESGNIPYADFYDEMTKYKDVKSVTPADDIDSSLLVSKAGKKFNLSNLFMPVSNAADANEDSQFAKVEYKTGRIYYVKLKNGDKQPNDKIGSIYKDPNNDPTGGSGGTSGGSGGTSTPTEPATSITEAKSESMLIKTIDSTVEDANGNKIIIPAGFKIKADESTNNATTVDKGIVITDSNNNEFVWIPVGKIYTDTTKTDGKAKTIGFNRYTFDSNGNATAQNDETIEGYCRELATSIYGNTVAKDIKSFKRSVSTNGGFYIGRYEARTTAARSSEEDEITPITENGSQNIYNYVTQLQAAELARNMYSGAKTFSSDLMNSYAWDTATLFLQTFGDNPEYSRQNTINTGTMATTGTNDTTKYTEKKDVQCNIYDMASNAYEWTTETGKDDDCYCIGRGGDAWNYGYTSRREGTNSEGYENSGFRPILYLNVEDNEESLVQDDNSVVPSKSTTHTATAITYSWEQLSNIAKMISNNDTISNDTAEVSAKLNGVTKTLGVGDTKTVDNKKVRILGFNHDTLSDATTAYEEETVTGKAGISFEYVEFIDVSGTGAETTYAQMNYRDSNSNGWKSCTLRSTLNGTAYNALSINDKIKAVNKEYIETYNNANSKERVSDKLWLLSCGEIWDNGSGGEVSKGWAIATEGRQYKYYKSTLGHTTYDTSSDITKKPNTSDPSLWWLRSPTWNFNTSYCLVQDGNCYWDYASIGCGVAPGFSI